jgi:hypothetical protein
MKNWIKTLKTKFSTKSFDEKINNRLPEPKYLIPMPGCKPPKTDNLSLMKELLNNSKTESVTINITKLGDVEEINIQATLRESV